MTTGLHSTPGEPIAIVAACPFPANRGTPARIRHITEILVRHGYLPHVVTYHLGSGPDVPGAVIHRTRAIRRYREFGAGPTFGKLLLLDPLLFFRLRKVVLEHGIRLIHAHHFEGAILALLLRATGTRCRIIYDAHTSLADEIHEYDDFRVPRVLRRAAASLLDSQVPLRADHVICVSDELAAFIRSRGVPAHRVSVVPMSVNTRDFLDRDPRPIREALGLENRRLVVYTGNLAPFQGVDALLQAFATVARRSPDAHLLLVSPRSDALEAQAAALGIADRLTCVGEKLFEEIPDYLAAADVVALPRPNCIGFPVKLLNYMAAGRPIVCFESTGAKALAHRQSGWLAADGDVTAFAEGILQCLEDTELSRSMGESARNEAIQRFEAAPHEKKLLEIYAGLLGS